eukprot:c19119_g1_i1.p1 GENE.c19119_g1_i1~~c19119_g1_i1.p1  ORF type:complete len:1045 (+),score=259.85 c19119_g1_i1:232-3135(+)
MSDEPKVNGNEEHAGEEAADAENGSDSEEKETKSEEEDKPKKTPKKKRGRPPASSTSPKVPRATAPAPVGPSRPTGIARSGTVVWAKMRGSPWWPAVTVNGLKTFGKEKVAELRKQGRYCVSFFASNRKNKYDLVADVDDENILLFTEHPDKADIPKSQLKKHKRFTEAVELAESFVREKGSKVLQEGEEEKDDDDSEGNAEDKDKATEPTKTPKKSTEKTPKKTPSKDKSTKETKAEKKATKPKETKVAPRVVDDDDDQSDDTPPKTQVVDDDDSDEEPKQQPTVSKAKLIQGADSDDESSEAEMSGDSSFSPAKKPKRKSDLGDPAPTPTKRVKKEPSDKTKTPTLKKGPGRPRKRPRDESDEEKPPTPKRPKKEAPQDVIQRVMGTINDNCSSDTSVLEAIELLKGVSVTLEILESTGIGKVITSLIKSPRGAPVIKAAKALKSEWKKIIDSPATAQASKTEVVETDDVRGKLRGGLETALKGNLEANKHHISRILFLDCTPVGESIAHFVEKHHFNLGAACQTKLVHKLSVPVGMQTFLTQTELTGAGESISAFFTIVADKVSQDTFSKSWAGLTVDTTTNQKSFEHLTHVYVAWTRETQQIPILAPQNEDAMIQLMTSSTEAHLYINQKTTKLFACLSETQLSDAWLVGASALSGCSSFIEASNTQLTLHTDQSHKPFPLHPLPSLDPNDASPLPPFEELGSRCLFGPAFSRAMFEFVETLTSTPLPPPLRECTTNFTTANSLAEALQEINIAQILESPRESPEHEEFRGLLLWFYHFCCRLPATASVLVRSAFPDGHLSWTYGHIRNADCRSSALMAAAPSKERAAEIEAFVFEMEGQGQASRKYKDKMRSLTFNLGAQGNPSLRARVLEGSLLPRELCLMSTQEMATDELKEYRKKVKKEATDKSMDATTDSSQMSSTDEFKCGKCHQRKCTFKQMQTRSADEPMTTFVSCVNCGNNWKF